ncbi:DNA-binding winged helix-turn-helix (wHTH) protein [Paraburkholderia sp. GAS199]|uniref:winged helix-turn-helix domain-containing protein n=1 Tax=Paraburkholderia sp. GAS199 TaxID=3035126 RepID=UPI003D1AFB44
MDVEKRRLMLEREDMELGSRAFDILLFIVAAGGRLVSRTELLCAVWKGVVVDESNLDVHLCRIRKKLGADRKLIVTVPRQGYFFASSRSAVDELTRAEPTAREFFAGPAPAVRTELAIALLRANLRSPARNSSKAIAGTSIQVVTAQRTQAWHMRIAMLRSGRVRARAARPASPGVSAASALRCSHATPVRRFR